MSRGSRRSGSVSGDQLAFDLGEATDAAPRADRGARQYHEHHRGAPTHALVPEIVVAASGTTPLARYGAIELAHLLERPEPTPEQIAVIEAPLAPLLVVAGAGSGKTETMAARVVWLVANGYVQPERVLGLTFTRKAAGELAERIRNRLRALSRLGLLEPDAAANPPANHVGGGIGSASVLTYHSYAASVLADHALLAGLDADARLISEAGAWQLADDLVERWTGPMDAVTSARSTVSQAVVHLAGELSDHLVTGAQVDELAAEMIAQLTALPDEAGLPHPVPGKPGAAVNEVLGALRARRQVLGLVAAFTQAKRNAGVVDFSDQQVAVARLAQRHPLVGQVERQRYPVVLLDEYQDTSHAQVAMLRALFGGGHAVTAVGDPHQSIYGWRGACAGTLPRFRTDFTSADFNSESRTDSTALEPAAVANLATSWRNDHAILNAANAVAEPLRARQPWSQAPQVAVPALQARPQAEQGWVRVAWCDTLEAEADLVAQEIRQAWQQGLSAAVLCRTRSHVPVVHAALVAAGVPTQVLGLGGLLHVPEVADVRAALEVVADPARGDSLMRLLTGAAFRLGPRDLDALGAWARELSAPSPTETTHTSDDMSSVAAGGKPAEIPLAQALETLPEKTWQARGGQQFSAVGHARLARLAGLLRYLRSRSVAALPDLVFETQRALGLEVEVAARVGADPDVARAALEAFVEVAATYEQQTKQPTLLAFVSWLQAAEETERGLDAPVQPARSGAVHLMTVHAAKGLEWDVVAVPTLVEGTFPTGHAGRAPTTSSGWLKDLGAVPYPVRGDADELPQWHLDQAATQSDAARELDYFRIDSGAADVVQERRLAYVAITRARHGAVLTGAVWGDGSRPRRPSRFLVDVAELAALPESGVECSVWTAPPKHGAQNPRDAVHRQVEWPVSMAVAPGLHEGAALVRAALAEPPASDEAAQPENSDAEAWDQQVTVLLADRDRRRAARAQVTLPEQLSASQLVVLATDPHQVALQVRRPMPKEPVAAHRRGQDFHAWVEQYWGASALFEPEDVPGAADEPPVADVEFERLCVTFLASSWSTRSPFALEVPVETVIGGVVVRGRIDAVFRDLERTPGPGVECWHVVDWKTGETPRDSAAQAARAVQLAVYRLAWARLRQVPVEQVRASFYYVGSDRTVGDVNGWSLPDLEKLITKAL